MNTNSSFHTELHTMGDNPRRFKDHPLKTVGAGGVVFIHKNLL